MQIYKINRWFKCLAIGILRHRWLMLCGFITLLVIGGWGMSQIVMKTSFDDYFISDDPMLLQTEEFKEVFGNDYYVAVLVRNDDVFSPKSLRLIRELSNELLDSLSYADKVTSLTNLEYMMGSEEGMTIEQIVPEVIPTDSVGLARIRYLAYSKPELSRRLVSRDGRMSWVLLKLRPFPADSVWKQTDDMAPDMVSGMEAGKVVRQEKYAALSPMVSGMPYLCYEKVQFLKGEMGQLFLFALLMSVGVMLLVTRSVRGIVMPLITSVGGLIVGMGVIGYMGAYVDMTTNMIALIVTFACSIAYNIHLYNFFKTRFVASGKRKASVVEAMGETGYGVMLSALTTVAAMMTFLAMNIVPMRAVGINTSVCLLSVMLTCLLITPIVLSVGKDRCRAVNMEKTVEGYVAGRFEAFGGWVLRYRKRVVTGVLLVAAICGAGLPYIEPAFDVERTMGRKVPYVKDFLDLCDTELGVMYSYDLMITLPKVDDAKQPANLRKLDALAKVAEGYELTKRHFSITDVVKDVNCTLHNNDRAHYAIPDDENMVAQLLLLYENAGGTEAEYWMDYDYRRLRLQIDLRTFNSNVAEQEMEDLQRRARLLYPKAEVTVVGNIPQFTAMQQYVERGQMWSMLISVGVIGLMLMLIFGSWRVGLIGMIPNIAPAIIVGGLMGWLNYPLDMMTASLIPMILGIAVDDTIHFINHFHMAYERCGSYDGAIKRAFRTEGMAVVMSTTIISMTFMGFCLSNCRQTVNWGVLAVAGMVSALLADLLLTPILLKYLKIFGHEGNK